MRLTCGHLIFGGLGLLLTGCAIPYYAASPAPVYYPLEGARLYYPVQRASISDAAPRRQGRGSIVRHTHHGRDEQRQAQRNDRRHSKANDWIDPNPLNGP